MADIYLLTHSQSTTFNDSYNSLLKFGYNPIIVNGYTAEDNLKPNTLCYNNLKDKILPLAIQNNKPIYYIEDDTIINEPLPELKEDIVRLAYWKLDKDEKNRRLCIGTSIVYFNTTIFNLLKTNIDKDRPQHLDLYISKFCNKNNIAEMIYGNYSWNEKKHISITLPNNGIRKHKRVIE